MRAAKEGKKYINVLIDEELQLELRPRMMLRKLTWLKVCFGGGSKRIQSFIPDRGFSAG